MTIIEVVEVLKAVIFGFVQGVTEWLPVSSTGHMILLNEFLPLYQSEEFLELFFVVIQFGSILAVPLLFWKRMVPCAVRCGFRPKPDILLLWGKIAVACIPAGVAALLWNDEINDLFYHPHVVVIMLIVVGILFLIVETRKREPSVHTVAELTWRAAWWIGCFQMIAAIFPGTSRSGATIIGALMIGVSRTAAAEFTFIMAVPVMLGASLFKMVQFGWEWTWVEAVILLTGMIVAFLVSLLVIQGLMNFIKGHSFKIFGWYRIGLGLVMAIYMFV